MICQFNNFADCRKQPNSFELINLSKLLCYALQYDADHRPDKLTTLFFSATLPSVLTIFGLQKIKRGSLNFSCSILRKNRVFPTYSCFIDIMKRFYIQKCVFFRQKPILRYSKTFSNAFWLCRQKLSVIECRPKSSDVLKHCIRL